MEAKTKSKTLYDALQSTKQEQAEDKTVEKVEWTPNKDMMADIYKANVKIEAILLTSDGRSR